MTIEAVDLGRELGVDVVRAGTAGTHPAFVSMIRELIEERLGERTEKRALGRYGPNHDVCPSNCCLPGTGAPSPWNATAPDLAGVATSDVRSTTRPTGEPPDAPRSA